MAYIKTNWVDGQSYGQSSFNNMEDGIANNDARLTKIENGEIATIGYDRKETVLLNKFMTNLRTVPYDEHKVAETQLEICFLGDSVLYGYVGAKDPEAVEEDCIADDGDTWSVRFGGGKTKPVRNQKRIHNGVINGLNAVYGANKVKPKLKLFSGYTAQLAHAHYRASGSDLIIINFGINDAIASWANAEEAGYQGNITSFINHMRALVERELDNGTAVVLMSPTRQTMMFEHSGSTDNNPDDTNNRTLIDAYEQAVRQLAMEYGCPLIDGQELTRNISNTQSYDFCHFTGEGNLSIGYRMCAYFIGQSPLFPNVVHSGAYLGVNPQYDNVNISGLTQFSRSELSPNNPIIMANKNLVYPVTDPDWKTKGLQATVSGTGSITWSFYTPVDGMVVIPSVYTNTQGQGVAIQLDFGGVQGSWNNYWNYVRVTNKPDYTYQEPSSVEIPHDKMTSISGADGKAYGLHMLNSKDQPVLKITTKGWHTISITMPINPNVHSVPDQPVGDGNFDVFGLSFMTMMDYKNLTKNLFEL